MSDEETTGFKRANISEKPMIQKRASIGEQPRSQERARISKETRKPERTIKPEYGSIPKARSEPLQ